MNIKKDLSKRKTRLGNAYLMKLKNRRSKSNETKEREYNFLSKQEKYTESA